MPTRPEIREWRFLLDENIHPQATANLETEGVYAEHVLDVFWEGAEDEADILSYVLERDLIVVTSDVSDFGNLPADAHPGIVLLYDNTMPAHRVASGLLAMVDAYSSREAFGGRGTLDDWI